MTTPATVYLDSIGAEYRLLAYDHDPATESWGLEAAHALGLDEDAVFKTLIAQLDTNELVVAVVPVSGFLDLKGLAAVAGGKRAAMAKVADAERATGYVAGGISPIAQRKVLRVFIDETAQLFDEIYVSAGRRGMDIGLSPLVLADATRAVFGAIARF